MSDIESAAEATKKAANENEEPLIITNEDLANLKKSQAEGKSGQNGKESQDSNTNEPSLIDFLASVPFELVGGATKLVAKTAEITFNAGRSLLQPERLEMMAETGRYVREMRELAGLTVDELAEAMNLEDNTVLEAVEKGTATLSFELILRLASVVARHDPVPFVMRTARTYSPSIWRILDNWGIGRIPLTIEREREFINIMRRHDAMRKISDEGFQHVLSITTASFDMALHYVAAQEGIEDKLIREKKTADSSGAESAAG